VLEICKKHAMSITRLLQRKTPSETTDNELNG